MSPPSNNEPKRLYTFNTIESHMHAQDYTFQSRIKLNQLDPENPVRNLYIRAAPDIEIDPKQVVAQLNLNRAISARNLRALGVDKSPGNHLGIEIRKSYDPFFSDLPVAKICTVALNGGSPSWFESQTLPEVLLARSPEEVSPEFERTYQPLFLYQKYISQIALPQNGTVSAIDTKIEGITIDHANYGLGAVVKFEVGKQFRSFGEYFARRVLGINGVIPDVPKPRDILRNKRLEDVVGELGGFEIALRTFKKMQEEEGKKNPVIDKAIYGVANLIYELLKERKIGTKEGDKTEGKQTPNEYPGYLVLPLDDGRLVKKLETEVNIKERAVCFALTPTYSPGSTIRERTPIAMPSQFTFETFSDEDYNEEQIRRSLGNYLGKEYSLKDDDNAKNLAELDKRILQRLASIEDVPCVLGNATAFDPSITYNIIDAFAEHAHSLSFEQQMQFLDAWELGLSRIDMAREKEDHTKVARVLIEVIAEAARLPTFPRNKILSDAKQFLSAIDWREAL